jgi:hypothetical protein
MKKLLFLFVLVLMSIGAKAQDSVAVKVSDARWTDIGVYFVDLFNYNNCRPVLWVCHENGDYYVEARLAFDWRETAAFFAGKTFSKSEKFWVTPKAGFLFGFNQYGYNGFSPEVNLGGKVGRFSYFSMNQFAISFQKKNPHYFYNYSRIDLKITNWLTLAYPAQIYVPIGQQSDYWLDQGPQLKVTVDKKIYVQPWYTFDLKHKSQKFIVGFGYVF